MVILGNFYFILGLVFIMVIILAANNYSPRKKVSILFVIALVLLFVEQPDWFRVLLGKVGIG